MNCLLVAATFPEISPLLDYLRKRSDEIASLLEPDILITGAGLTSATYHITKQLSIKRPDLIIQAGIGGCFDPAIPLGKVLVVKKEAIADMGVMESGNLRSAFDLSIIPKNRFPFKNGWLVNESEVLKMTRLKKVTGISVNEITTSNKRMNIYREQFSPVIESMEGAALHFVSLMEKIPFIQLRAVSNYIGERNKLKWRMELAIGNLNQELLHLLQKLNLPSKA